jgi:DivIVA domain-containing protein
MPRDIAYTPLLDPDQLAGKTFSSSFRGFDQDEVRVYLLSLADQLRELKGSYVDLQRRLEATQARVIDQPDLDEEQLTRLLGEETARVLSSAREAATHIRAKAEDNVARMVREAAEQADETRQAADQYAAEVRGSADREVEARVYEVEARNADIRAEAEAYSEKVRAEADATIERLTADAERAAAAVRTAAEAHAERVKAEADDIADRRLADAEAHADSVRTEADLYGDQVRTSADDAAARTRAEADGVFERRAAEAEESADAMRRAARAEADAIGADADRARADAEAEAEAAREAGRREGREMVAEARRVRERVLQDLARRRKQARQQLEQLRAARERLLESFEVVRRTVEESTQELMVSLPEARVAAEDAGRRVASEPETSVDQLEVEIEAARQAGLPVVAPAFIPDDPPHGVPDAAGGVEPMDEDAGGRAEGDAALADEIEAAASDGTHLSDPDEPDGAVDVDLTTVVDDGGDLLGIEPVVDLTGGDEATDASMADAGPDAPPSDDLEVETAATAPGSGAATDVASVGVGDVDDDQAVDQPDTSPVVEAADASQVVDVGDAVDNPSAGAAIHTDDEVDGSADDASEAEAPIDDATGVAHGVDVSDVDTAEHAVIDVTGPDGPDAVDQDIETGAPGSSNDAGSRPGPADGSGTDRQHDADAPTRDVDALFAKLRESREKTKENARAVLAADPAVAGIGPTIDLRDGASTADQHSTAPGAVLVEVGIDSEPDTQRSTDPAGSVEERTVDAPEAGPDGDRPTGVADEVTASSADAEEIEVVPSARQRATRSAATGRRPRTGTAASRKKKASAVPPPAEPVVDEPETMLVLLERRDGATEAVERSIARKLKRVLADEQSHVLDAIRRTRGLPGFDEVFPSADEHTGRFAAAAIGDLRRAAMAGKKFDLQPVTGSPAGNGAVDATVPDVDDVADDLGREFSSLLRPRIERCWEDLNGDEDELNDRVRAVYREWKTPRLADTSRHFILLAFSRGLYDAVPVGTCLRWIVDDGGQPCPDAEDNSLAGAVERGEAFPTGHIHPPAHPGCRCLAIPASRLVQDPR